MTPEQIHLLRIIKRSAALLIALLHCDQPITARQLSDLLEADYTTTRSHLNDLIAHGLAQRVTGGYLPTQRADQLVLIKSYPQVYTHPVDNFSASNQNAVKPRYPKLKARKNRASANSPQSKYAGKPRFQNPPPNQNAIKPRSHHPSQNKYAGKPRFHHTKTRENRAFAPPLLSTIIIKNHNIDLNNNSTTPETRENRALPTNQSAEKPHSPIWETLSQYGILPNARTRKLETIPHITPELINQLAKQINKPFPQYAGLLIRALEHAIDNPTTDPNDHRKYVKGKYADYINH